MSAIEQVNGTNDLLKKLENLHLKENSRASNGVSETGSSVHDQPGQAQFGQDLLAGLQTLGLNWTNIQQAVNASKLPSNQQQSPNSSVDPSSFVPGAISNRTLEHLTETMARPGQQMRAIRGSDYRGSSPLADHNPQQTSKVGTIGDSRPQSTSQLAYSPGNISNLLNGSYLNSPIPSYGAPFAEINYSGHGHVNTIGKDGGLGNRSTGPADSDTSGISTGSGSDLSETALLDLMYNLSIGTKTTSCTQTTPPGNARQLLGQQASTPVGMMQSATTANQPPAMFGHVGLGSQLPCPPGFGPIQQPVMSQMDFLRALGISDVPSVSYPMVGSNTMPLCQQVLGQPGILNSQSASLSTGSAVSSNLTGLDFLDSNKLATLSTLLSGNNLANPDLNSIEKAAKMYRNAAAICEATCTWSGQLPPKIYKNPTYSCKVFLGGVPWDITESGLQQTFKMFGTIRIEWPQEGKHKVRNPMKAGYVYVLFEGDRAVKSLLQACTHDFSNGGEYYYKISSRRMRSKEVQVIPWVLSDSNYVKQPSQRLDPTRTVFVGALHGMMNAEGLANIMNDLFGNVVYAGIDTDKHKYPIGSGRVTFSSHKSFMKAVNAAFVEVKTPKFTKKIQIDPYLEDSMCNSCATQAGPYFCRDLSCFRYYCQTCWQWNHSYDATRHHKPLMRNNARANAEVN